MRLAQGCVVHGERSLGEVRGYEQRRKTYTLWPRLEQESGLVQPVFAFLVVRHRVIMRRFVRLLRAG